MVDIHLQGVSKGYEGQGNGVSALEDVSIDVADGEFFTLVGPSGCGKTTTLRLLAGFETPTSGSIRFGDRRMAGVPPERRDIGMVVQDYALFPHMSVADNVGYGLRFREPPAGASVTERVEELLALVDLDGLGDRDPTSLSGGQRQRVALARALAPDPQLLLLDEPLSALDARLRKTLRRQIGRIQSELGVTTVYVTHDQEEALAISDRIAVMNDGRVEQVGAPETVYRRPATRFVAGFVGENTVFEGRVIDTRESSSGTRLASVDCGGDTFTVRSERAVSGPVTFCVRPTAFSRTADDNRIRARIEHVEFLGGIVRIHARWNRTPVVVTADSRPDDETLEVGFSPADAWLLDE